MRETIFWSRHTLLNIAVNFEVKGLTFRDRDPSYVIWTADFRLMFRRLSGRRCFLTTAVTGGGRSFSESLVDGKDLENHLTRLDADMLKATAFGLLLLVPF